MADTADPPIEDEVARSRLVLHDADAEAELVYRRSGDRLVIVHTGVPDDLGGHGIGGRLVRAALELAAAEGRTVVPWCPFARRWLREHPDEVVVPVDWTSRPG